jgi:hypothetical protein
MNRRKEMSALLARRERDGLSLRRLSNETGIPIGTLSWWSWRLRRGDDAGQGAGRFVELVPEGSSSSASVILRVGNGVEIEAQSGIDATWLSDLVSALRSC